MWLFMGILCIKRAKVKRSLFTFLTKVILTKIQSSGSILRPLEKESCLKLEFIIRLNS